MNAPGEDLAPAALAIAKVEYPSLEAEPYLALLDRMGVRPESIGDSTGMVQHLANV